MGHFLDGGATPEQVVPGCISNETEEVSKQHFFVLVPALALLHDGPEAKLNPFLIKLLLVMLFFTATESKQAEVGDGGSLPASLGVWDLLSRAKSSTAKWHRYTLGNGTWRFPSSLEFSEAAEWAQV